MLQVITRAHVLVVFFWLRDVLQVGDFRFGI